MGNWPARRELSRNFGKSTGVVFRWYDTNGVLGRSSRHERDAKT
jgi:hypothetical protein